MNNDDQFVYYDSANYRSLRNIEPQTTDLYLNHCGMECCDPDHEYCETPRSNYLIHICLNGTGLFRSGTHNFTINAGQAFLILPGQSDYYYCADHEHPWTYMWIGFDGTQAASYLQHIGFSPENPVRDTHIPLKHFQATIQDLLNTKTLTLSNEIKRVGYLYRFLALLASSHQFKQPKCPAHECSSKTYAAYAADYIKNNYRHASITDVANQVGIDRSYLHHVFKKVFNMSPQEYLISYRLKIASSLLTSTSLTMQQIAHEVGYEDSLQFSKIFKKHYNLSPKSYRNSTDTERIF